MGKKRINAIIQARMGSTRLPGKVLMKIEDIPILGHIIYRLSTIDYIDKVIVATSDSSSDDDLEKYCTENAIPFIRGSEDNVLERFYLASIRFPADDYIRATGDNPMIDTGLIKSMIDYYQEHSLSYTMYKNFPVGSGVEIFSHWALVEAYRNADKEFEKEHVTPYMYQRMNSGKVDYYVSPKDRTRIRMTVDTVEDLAFAKAVFEYLYRDNKLFGINEIEKLLQNNPELQKINNEVHQKILGE